MSFSKGKSVDSVGLGFPMGTVVVGKGLVGSALGQSAARLGPGQRVLRAHVPPLFFLQPTCQPRRCVGRRCGPGPLVAREGLCRVPPPLPALRSPFLVTPWEALCVAGSPHRPHCCLVLSVLLSVSQSVFYESVLSHKRGLFLCAGLWGDWVKGTGVMWPRGGKWVGLG